MSTEFDRTPLKSQQDTIKVAEMFAGVGGFRLGLEGYHNPAHPELDVASAGPYHTVWANQWEPDGRQSKQFAWKCYEYRFGKGSCVNEDISKVLDEFEAGKREIPDFDLLVGGFPCQDYSVANKNHAGIEGKKGVLWWSIYRMLKLKRPSYCLFENVDRLLLSPASQKGRDFAIILSCLNTLGYDVEWRVINAAEYGMPQKRRRTFIYGERKETHEHDGKQALKDTIITSGVLAKAFPIENNDDAIDRLSSLVISPDLQEISTSFNNNKKATPFQNAGAMINGQVMSMRTRPSYDGTISTIRDIMVNDESVPESYFINNDDIPKWEYKRSSKRIPRVSRNGHEYAYSEGKMKFPDPIDEPSRTILTSENGKSPSRMTHAIRGTSNRIRRLVPEELEALQAFPKGWTEWEGEMNPMTSAHRAFCMGNALVVEIPHRIGVELSHRIRNLSKKSQELPDGPH